MERLNLRQKRNLYIILFVTLLSVAGVSSIIPVFPQLSKALDVSRDKIGLLITVFTLPGAILAPVIGIIADRWGRKKILMLALLLFGITGTLCFFSREFEIILILRFFQGLGAACLGIVNITLIGDIFSGNQKIKAMGYNSSVLSIATALFPAVGGLLAAINWNYPFLIPVLAIFLSFLVFFYLDNPEPNEKSGFLNYFRNVIKSIFTKKAVILFLLNFATFTLLFGVIMTYLPIFLQDQFDMSSKMIGFLLSFMSVSAGLIAFQLSRISKVFSMKVLLTLGFVAYLTGFIIFPFVETLYGLLILIFVIGMGQGITIPTVFNLLTNISPLEHRGVFMSVNSTAIRAGQTVGPVFTGFLFSLWGLSWVFWTGAIVAACFILLIVIFIPSYKRL